MTLPQRWLLVQTRPEPGVCRGPGSQGGGTGIPDVWGRGEIPCPSRPRGTPAVGDGKGPGSPRPSPPPALGSGSCAWDLAATLGLMAILKGQHPARAWGCGTEMHSPRPRGCGQSPAQRPGLLSSFSAPHSLILSGHLSTGQRVVRGTGHQAPSSRLGTASEPRGTQVAGKFRRRPQKEKIQG